MNAKDKKSQRTTDNGFFLNLKNRKSFKGTFINSTFYIKIPPIHLKSSFWRKQLYSLLF